MKPFIFRLDSILKLRAREETQARERFDQSMQTRFRAELELSEARTELDSREQAIAEKRAGRASGNDHIVLLNAAQQQRECCARLTARLDAARKEMETHRELFQTARRKHQAVLRLRERQQRTHVAAEERREENAISDLIISRHALRNGGAFA